MCNSEEKGKAKSSALFWISSHIPDSHPRLLRGPPRWNTFQRETGELKKKKKKKSTKIYHWVVGVNTLKLLKWKLKSRD